MSLATRAVALCAWLLVACGDDGRSHRFVDTTGARFEFSCTDRECTIVRLDDGACGSEVLLDGARFLIVTTDDSDGVAFSENGRIVTCESDADCAGSHNFPALYACRMGRCEDPSWDPQEITPSDVFALCLADLSREAYCRTEVLHPEPGPERVQLASAACATRAGDDAWPNCRELPAACGVVNE